MFQRDQAAREQKNATAMMEQKNQYEQQQRQQQIDTIKNSGANPDMIAQAILEAAGAGKNTADIYKHANPHQTFQEVKAGDRSIYGGFNPATGGFQESGTAQYGTSPDALERSRSAQNVANINKSAQLGAASIGAASREKVAGMNQTGNSYGNTFTGKDGNVYALNRATGEAVNTNVAGQPRNNNNLIGTIGKFLEAEELANRGDSEQVQNIRKGLGTLLEDAVGVTQGDTGAMDGDAPAVPGDAAWRAPQTSNVNVTGYANGGGAPAANGGGWNPDGSYGTYTPPAMPNMNGGGRYTLDDDLSGVELTPDDIKDLIRQGGGKVDYNVLKQAGAILPQGF
jgi:hypothetical protein